LSSILPLQYLRIRHFGFDFTDKHTRETIISLALEHCYDPVVDMLAEAEKKWDDIKRLDRMAQTICARGRLGLGATTRINYRRPKKDRITMITTISPTK
jgi:hypothetical protein